MLQGLDPAGARLVEKAVENVIKALKDDETTIVFVTNKLPKVLKADNVLVINDASDMAILREGTADYCMAIKELKATIFKGQEDEDDPSFYED